MENVRNFARDAFSLAAAILIMTSGVLFESSWGATWTEINSGLPSAAVGVGALTVDPATPSTIYALTSSGGIFKSTDGGGSWKAVSNVAGVSSLVIDPKSPSTIYAVTDHGIVKSTDGAANWIGANTGLTDSFVSMLAIDPVNPSTLYAVTNSSIFKSTNGGANWIVMHTDLPPNNWIRSLTIDPITPSTIYAVEVQYGGIFKSTDGGESWTAIKTGGSGSFAASVVSLAIDPTDSSTIYAGSFASVGISKSTDVCVTLPNGSSFCPSASAGISKSTDGGQSWNAFNAGIPSGTFVRSLAIDPSTPSRIYATYYVFDGGWGVVKSTDSGESWSVINTGLPPGPGSGSLAIDPKTPSTIYAGYFVSGTGGGISKSTDGGASWNAANTGLPSIDIRALAIDPVNVATVYAGGAGGLFKTVNRGANWTNPAAFQIPTPSFPPCTPLPSCGPPIGEGPGSVRFLVIDIVNPNILYAGTARSDGCWYLDRLLFKSTDGGATWSDSVSPPASGCSLSWTPQVMVVDPTNPNVFYLGEGDLDNRALLKSTDGGASWSHIWDLDNGLPSYVSALVVDPANPATLYAGTHDGYNPPGSAAAGLFKSTDGALWKSTDGGASWRNLFPSSLTDVYAVAVNPQNPSTIYAGTGGHGVFKSADGGESWIPIPPSPNYIFVLAFDPQNPNTVYAGGPGGLFAITFAP